MPPRVLVGMSGGVDSAVAAYILMEQGYEVIAGFMKNYADESNPNCHTKQDRDMAIQVSKYLGIKSFEVFDFRKEYHETIIQYIYNTYKQGLTPNPDILCNTEVKFKLFLQEGINIGCDYIATGHYARIKPVVTTTDMTAKNNIKGNNIITNSAINNISGHKYFKLLKGIDLNKDQSYFLSGLNQEQLSKSLFPIGGMVKSQVRKIAHEIGLPNADRKDSQGLCFIGKVRMKDFLQEALPIQIGNIVDQSGKILGQHDGIWFYTIGQRQGLGLAGGPRYVVTRDVKTNTLIVGHEKTDALFCKHISTSQLHWIKGQALPLPIHAKAKIRYRQTDQTCTIQASTKQNIRIDFDEPQRAISPGQTVAIYNDDELIASGIITNSF